MGYDALPQEIIRLPQWVNAYKNSKLPMRSYEPKAASSVDPDTWSDFETAKQMVDEEYYDYLGFVFADNGIVGIDLDDAFDDNGLLSGLSADIIGKCQSYTEKSRSGNGIHILVKGDLAFRGRNNRNGVEIYKSGRYFIMTGKTLVFHDLIENQAAIDYIVKKYFPEMIEDDEASERMSKALYKPVYPPIIDGKIPLRPIYPDIPDGCRNISLTSLAGTMHTVGYDYEAIYDELMYVNGVACKPPLDDYEIRQIVNSITKYRI